MTRRGRSGLLLLLLLVVVNLPLVHGTWTQSRVESSGIEVTATVTDQRAQGSEYWVEFTFPEDVDPDRRTWRARVDEAAYVAAEETGRIDVRVLEDDPSAYRVDGTVEGNGVLVATLLADGVLVVALLLFWRFRGRMGHLRARLRAVALEDVTRGRPGVLLERIEGETYLIQGEVMEIEPGRLVLDLGNRSVDVLLDGHQNPVGHQQPAQVRARLIG